MPHGSERRFFWGDLAANHLCSRRTSFQDIAGTRHHRKLSLLCFCGNLLQYHFMIPLCGSVKVKLVPLLILLLPVNAPP